MTGLLKETMREHADAQAPPAIDIETIISAGSRRVARTRVAAGSLAVAAVTLAAVGFPQLLDGSGTPGDEGLVAGQGREAATPFAERRPTYAVDGTIHYGDTSIDVGQRVESFVQTDGGFVYATIDGQVHLADGTTNAPIGRTSPDGLYLKADDTGSVVAWVEFAAGQAPELVVYDTADRKEVVRTDEGTRPDMQSFRDTDSVYVYAIDDGTVYGRNADGVTALDVATGTSELLLTGSGAFDVTDVANGHFAHLVREVGDENSALRVSTDLAHPAAPLPSGWSGRLSPGAVYVSTEEGDEVTVYDVATHQEVTPDTGGYAFVGAYAWLDDDTVSMIGTKSLGGGSQPIDFLTCEVPKGACAVAEKGVATYSEDGPVPLLALPIGERLEG